MSRNTFLYIFICAIVSCMSACDKNAHEKELYGISVRLTFDDELDASQTKVKNGSLWIYQVDGKLVKEYFYEGAKDLSSQCFDLPAGNYVVVSALNFNSPLTYKNQNEMQALAFYTSAPDPLSEHAFYSTVQVEVRENENQLVTLPMKRVFSEPVSYTHLDVYKRQAQNTTAVNRDDMAYTSPSTAENQNVSVNV